jgi:hypothetical protein
VSLPASGNTLGDARIVRADGLIRWWNGASWVASGVDSANYVLKNGGEMVADPSTDLGVATKHYTDAGSYNAASNIYDSGWFPIATANSYLKTHNLGAIPRIIMVYLSNSATGVNAEQAYNGDVYSNTLYDSGMAVVLMTTTELTLKTGATYLNNIRRSSYTFLTSGYARVIAIK